MSWYIVSGIKSTISFSPLAKPTEIPKKEWKDEQSDVHHLTSETFGEFTKDKGVLVMFYAPWCGHCNSMKPAYAETAKRLKEQKFPGVLAAIDATKNNEISLKEGVKGYPTCKFRFKNLPYFR